MFVCSRVHSGREQLARPRRPFSRKAPALEFSHFVFSLFECFNTSSFLIGLCACVGCTKIKTRLDKAESLQTDRHVLPLFRVMAAAYISYAFQLRHGLTI